MFSLSNYLGEALSVKELDVVPEEDVDDESDSGGDGVEIEEEEEDGLEESMVVAVRVQIPARSVPKLSVKEKKGLAWYAHSLGDQLKYQPVGKSVVTANVLMTLGETLEANGLLKS